MEKSKLSAYVGEILKTIKTIRLVELSALQSTNAQKTLNQLQMAAGELSKSIAENEDKNSLLEKHNQLVQAVDTAGLVGVISNDELTDYYKHLDDIWAELEKIA